ncbi:hypothetical protein BSP12_003 [Bacillus phage BSP12]|nr:hypothetical protein BSP12_003 [Bacillus phage BSP12]
MIGESRTELKPVYDNCKSFYKKAWVLESEEVKQLLPYQTIVAEIRDGEAEVFGTYSNTTLRHIKEFLYQNGFEIGTKKEIEKMYIMG